MNVARDRIIAPVPSLATSAMGGLRESWSYAPPTDVWPRVTPSPPACDFLDGAEFGDTSGELCLASSASQWIEESSDLLGRFHLGKQLSETDSSVVLVATEPAQGDRTVVVKITNRDKLNSVQIMRAQRELVIMSMVDHPNIIRVFDLAHSDRYLAAVLEFAPGGDLHDYLCSQPRHKLREDLAALYFAQIVDAVRYLHSWGYCHRDLKPENVFLDASKRFVQLGDFGYACAWSENELHGASLGTLYYASPEIVRLGGVYYGPEVDVWALGVLLYVLLTGCIPFYGADVGETRDLIKQGVFPALPRTISVETRSLVRDMLQADPAQRITVFEVARAEFVCRGRAEVEKMRREAFPEEFDEPTPSPPPAPVREREKEKEKERPPRGDAGAPGKPSFHINAVHAASAAHSASFASPPSPLKTGKVAGRARAESVGGPETEEDFVGAASFEKAAEPRKRLLLQRMLHLFQPGARRSKDKLANEEDDKLGSSGGETPPDVSPRISRFRLPLQRRNSISNFFAGPLRSPRRASVSYSDEEAAAAAALAAPPEKNELKNGSREAPSPLALHVSVSAAGEDSEGEGSGVAASPAVDIPLSPRSKSSPRRRTASQLANSASAAPPPRSQPGSGSSKNNSMESSPKSASSGTPTSPRSPKRESPIQGQK